MAAWYSHTWAQMEFNDSFEIENIQIENVWDALSDPVIVRNSLPGCKCLVEVEDKDNVDFDAILEDHAETDPEVSYAADDHKAREFKEDATYASVVSVSIGPVNPRFDTLVTIEDRDFPSMEASGEGSTSDSSFEMESSMTLEETSNGVSVDWEASVDIVGRLAQMGQRMINPAANRVVKKFFTDIESELAEATSEPGDNNTTELQHKEGQGIIARLKQLLGIDNNA